MSADKKVLYDSDDDECCFGPCFLFSCCCCCLEPVNQPESSRAVKASGKISPEEGKKSPVKEFKEFFKLPVLKAVEAACKDGERFPEINNVASVKETCNLPDVEKKFINERSMSTQKALSSLLSIPNMNIQDTPKISIAMSGGGFRSMMGSLGFLQGLKESGIYDCATYCASLSGSTYALCQYIMKGPNFDLVRNELINAVQDDLIDIPALHLLCSDHASPFLHALLQKHIYKQPVSIANLFGVLLFEKFFPYEADSSWKEQYKYYIKLSDQQRSISPSASPYPIYSAVHYDSQSNMYPWVSFTPDHLHLSHYNLKDKNLTGTLPIWGIGRQFDKGVSLTANPEIPLGILMGVWGSGFCAPIGRIWEGVKVAFDYDHLEKVVDHVVQGKEILNKHMISPIKFPNPFYNIRGEVNEKSKKKTHDNKPMSPSDTISQEKWLDIFDGGADFNFPLSPLVHPERSGDIVILFDASDHPETNNNFERCNEFMRRWDIKFPVLRSEKALKSTVSVFSCENGNGPTVIYFPLVNLRKRTIFNPKSDPRITPRNQALVDKFDPLKNSVTEMTNFVWKEDDVMAMTELMRLNVLNSRQTIIDTIRDVYKRKTKG